MSSTSKSKDWPSFSHFRQHEIILGVALLALRIHFDICPPYTRLEKPHRELIIGCLNFDIPQNLLVFWLECKGLEMHESKVLMVKMLEQFDHVDL